MSIRTTRTPDHGHGRGSAPPGADAEPRLIGPGLAVGLIAPAVVLAIGTVAAVNLAIPELAASSLRPSVAGTAWIVDSYTLVFACLLIPAGALGDRFGRKRGMLTGLGLFGVGSVLAALAPSVAVLMTGRAVSGAGAALMLPATLAVALNRVAPPHRPRTVALWSGLTGIGGVVGNLGGGLAVELGGWRALFWAGALIAVLAAAVIGAAVPPQTPHHDPVDVGGAALLTAGSVALLYGIIDGPARGWASAPVLASLIAAVVLLPIFAAYELRQQHPMLDPRLFRLAGVRSGAIGITAMFFALFGLFYLNAQYLQDLKGYSPLLTGVCILPIAIVMPVASTRGLAVARRIGERPTVIFGLLCVVAGLALLSFVTASTPYPCYGLLLALVGAGIGLAMAPLSGLMVHALPPAQGGLAAGLNSTTRELGSALGVAVLSTILISRFAGHLPARIRLRPGASGQAIRHSITMALNYAAHVPGRAASSNLVSGTHVAFTTGMSAGLRVGAALLLVATVILAWHYPAVPSPRRGDRDLPRR